MGVVNVLVGFQGARGVKLEDKEECEEACSQTKAQSLRVLASHVDIHWRTSTAGETVVYGWTE